MNKMLKHIVYYAFTALFLFGTLTDCGFLQKRRLTEPYFTHVVAPNTGSCVVLWPVHLVALLGAAVIDQSIHTFEAVPPAARDAVDFFFLEGNGNNIMLELTVAVPKTLATPLIFIGSYLARWFVPFSDTARPFHIQRPPKPNREQEPAKEPAQDKLPDPDRVTRK